METNKIFLGGTCNESTWREELIPLIQVDFFNPVVEDWTKECQLIEWVQKENKCNIHLYIITREMTGVFSIAEVVQSSLTEGKITILHIIPNGFTKGQLKSLTAVMDLVKSNGAIGYIDNDIERTARTLNNCFL